MKSEKKNYAFIDSQNVNLAIRAQGWKLDFKRFRVYLRERLAKKKGPRKDETLQGLLSVGDARIIARHSVFVKKTQHGD